MRLTAIVVCILCTVAFAGVAPAQDIAGKWINLFDGESTFGWVNLGDTNWTVQDGVLTATDGSGGMLATTSQFKDFELRGKIRVKPGCSSGIVVRSPLDGHPTSNGAAVIWLREVRDSDGAWHDIAVTAQGNSLFATVDGRDVTNFSSSNALGYIGILYHHNNDAVVEVSELRLRPLAMKSLFNGKDLSGWNVIPGRKSVFSVVDGALNIKNGNGQIETAGTYKDFVLQLDIISNGENLNSGVFFRGPVGVFWKGYESQVRNQWQGDDRTKPVDYGTGGIYGNQAARKVVSSDGEWFTKTVVVNDNHMAVWIDGYQVSDFTDTRPVHPGDDAKAGFVPSAGTIHLQGHDPTTDLSFTNIHISQYPD